MAELPFQTWLRVFNQSWPNFSQLQVFYDQLGIKASVGTATGNVALQKAVQAGWRPGQPSLGTPGTAPKPAAKPAPRKAPAPAPKAAATTSTGVPVQPGLQAEQFADRLALEKFIADQLAQLEQQRIDLQEGRDADARTLQEAQLAANPADFVAYELFKRSLVEQGFEIQGTVRTDEEIQNIFQLALDLENGGGPRGILADIEPGGIPKGILDNVGGGTGGGIDFREDPNALIGPPERQFVGTGGLSPDDILGIGQFGVELPTTGSISRSQLNDFSATDLALLSSFLRGGVETDGGEFQGINPEDFFKELGEGLVPVLPSQRTQFAF